MSTRNCRTAGILGGHAENVGQVQIELTPFGERRMPAAEIERQWRTLVGKIEGAERISFLSSFANFGDDVSFELAHQYETSLVAAADAMKERLAGIAGLNQVEDDFDLGKRQLVFELTDAGMEALRVTQEALSNLVEGLEGTIARGPR